MICSTIPTCTRCASVPADTRSPLVLCRACYDMLGKHGRHDLAWLRSLPGEWMRIICMARMAALEGEGQGWPLYRGPMSGYGVAWWVKPTERGQA